MARAKSTVEIYSKRTMPPELSLLIYPEEQRERDTGYKRVVSECSIGLVDQVL